MTSSVESGEVTIGSLSWCWLNRPPEDPPSQVLSAEKVFEFKYNNTDEEIKNAWLEYADLCNITEPQFQPTTSDYSSSTPTPTPVIPSIDQSTVITDGPAIASGTLVAIIICLLLVITVFLILAYCWYRKKNGRTLNFKRINPFSCSSSTNSSLSMEEYENKNYLHNKAVQGENWKTNGGVIITSGDKAAVISQKLQEKEEEEGRYSILREVKGQNPTSDTGVVTSSRNFDKLNIRDTMKSGCATVSGNTYENENFQADSDAVGNAHSPSAKSDTPLFDEVDGKHIPNATPPNGHTITEAVVNVTANSYPVEQSQKIPMAPQPNQKLPPIQQNGTSNNPVNGVDKKSLTKKTKKSNKHLQKHKSEELKDPSLELVNENKDCRKSY